MTATAALRGRAGGGDGGPSARGLAEQPAPYGTSQGLAEHELVALWLLGRVPEATLPWPLLRPGRAGQGPGPDVREATFSLPSGVVRTGAVEVHLRASDFARHGHDRDPAYARVIAHLVWEDDRPAPGSPTALPGGATAPTVVVGPALGHSPARLRALVRRGPRGAEPCVEGSSMIGADELTRRVRHEGQRRLAERTWHAAALVAERGWDGAWAELLERALLASAGRCHESHARRAALALRITCALGDDPVAGLCRAAAAGPPRVLINALRAHGTLGQGRAAEVGWNAALPFLAALAAAYEDIALGRHVAALVAAWPAPRPYGRTRALAGLLGPAASPAGALYAQGLLHLQDLWCERGCCGACPLSPPSQPNAGRAP
ncbi:MAG: DUF2851 family protein [Dehalococcoidia bacterium]